MGGAEEPPFGRLDAEQIDAGPVCEQFEIPAKEARDTEQTPAVNFYADLSEGFQMFHEFGKSFTSVSHDLWQSADRFH